MNKIKNLIIVEVRIQLNTITGRTSTATRNKEIIMERSRRMLVKGQSLIFRTEFTRGEKSYLNMLFNFILIIYNFRVKNFLL